jgi:aspartate aminotransferase
MHSALSYAQARLCAPTIDQLVAVPSVELGSEYFDRMVAEYKQRRDTVISGLESMEGVEFQVPNGAFYIIVRLPVSDTEDFVRWMLTSFDLDGDTVMLAPAAGFYTTPGMGMDQVRIAFVLDVEKTKRAMDVLKEGLRAYKKRTGH